MCYLRNKYALSLHAIWIKSCVATLYASSSRSRRTRLFSSFSLASSPRPQPPTDASLARFLRHRSLLGHRRIADAVVTSIKAQTKKTMGFHSHPSLSASRPLSLCHSANPFREWIQQKGKKRVKLKERDFHHVEVAIGMDFNSNMEQVDNCNDRYGAGRKSGALGWVIPTFWRGGGGGSSRNLGPTVSCSPVVPGKCLYVVVRNFFLLLLNCSAWPSLGPA